MQPLHIAIGIRVLGTFGKHYSMAYLLICLHESTLFDKYDKHYTQKRIAKWSANITVVRKHRSIFVTSNTKLVWPQLSCVRKLLAFIRSICKFVTYFTVLDELLAFRAHRSECYSIPCAKIITRPGSTIIFSSTCVLSHWSTSTACLPGTLLHTYFSYDLLI